MGATQSLDDFDDVTPVNSWWPTRPTTSGHEGHVGNLKLEAQKIKEFLGKMEDFPRWKNRTECAFDGSGYEKILEDRNFAIRHQKMNKIVYSQLAVATCDGTAYHLVKKHEETKDGNAAWNELLQWYDGDHIRTETADSLRAKLDSLTLSSGGSAETYINKFEIWMQELDRIEGERYSPSHRLQLFLKNIEDPSYETTVTFLKNSDGLTMSHAINTIRRHERDLIERRKSKRKLEGKLRRLSGTGLQDSDGKPKRARRMNGKIQLTQKGTISVPRDKWFGKEMEEDDKQFVQEWNRRVKHGESTDELTKPEGLTILPPVLSKARRAALVERLDGTPELTRIKRKTDEMLEADNKRISFHLEPTGEEEE